MERNWSNIMFSFEGRITRSEYWIGIATVVAGIFGTALLAVGLLAGFDALLLKPVGAVLGSTLYLAMIIAVIWASFALSIKRLHDQGMSGWWLLLQLIPYLGPLVLLIILGFLPGSAGSNQFGPNPNDPDMTTGEWMVNSNP